MTEAHEDMVADPSRPGEVGCNVSGCHDDDARPSYDSACEACHETAAHNWTNSLHANLQGEVASIEARCGRDIDDAGYRGAFDNQCAACHATCGQCHVSRPNSAGGGFVHLAEATVSRSHRFAEPDMKEQCTACHGTRVATDYLSEGSNIPDGKADDVHWVRRAMDCFDCHDAIEEYHGDGTVQNHRYEVSQLPRCEECHGDGIDDDWTNTFHTTHVNGTGPNLQCQVCHSQPYRNCVNCHVDPADGLSHYDEFFDLKIAKNDPEAFPYRQTMGYDYVLVRHVPISNDTYDHWGLTELDELASRPTWLYTSPHNIIKRTVQAESCGSCHDSAYYLTSDDLDSPVELEANASIVIE